MPPLLPTIAPGGRNARTLERLQHAVEPHVGIVAIGVLALVGLA